MRSLAERFWRKVQKTPGCWNWTGVKNGRYGQIRVPRQKRKMYAHRLSWMLTYGPIPKELLVLHHCDNPKCVNPAHLFLGTDRDNHLDCLRKGRSQCVRNLITGRYEAVPPRRPPG